MSLRILPSFGFTPRIPPGGGAHPEELGLRRLREVVAGRDASFPRQAAMALLAESDFPNKDLDLAALLENENESPRIRYLAALTLGRIRTAEALRILVRNVETRDEGVQAAVMRSLGRLGDRSALDAIAAVMGKTGGMAERDARFAAALISHRLGLEGNDLPVPEEKDYLDILPGAARPIQFIRADAADAEFCLRSLAADPFGIEFAEQPMYLVRCGRTVLMVVFARELFAPSRLRSLEERKTIAGVVALRNPTSGLYSVSLLILTSPARPANGFHVLLAHPHGKVAYGGSARVEEDTAEFSIRAVAHPGAFAVRIQGRLLKPQLQIQSAISAFFTSRPRRPREGGGPGDRQP